TESPGDQFLQELSSRNNRLEQALIINPKNIDSLTGDLTKLSPDNPPVIAVFSKIVSWKERSGLSQTMLDSINTLLKKHSDTIVISFGSPYIYNELLYPKTFICTYSHCKSSQIACAEALFGEIPISGIPPVSLKNHALLSPTDTRELKRRQQNRPSSQG
ncbi:MAG: hypothetical protein OEZ36_00285, partial [Spirochaetota bacterium]|nr:hypothetical protein [Spirochaetota bacterium]